MRIVRLHHGDQGESPSAMKSPANCSASQAAGSLSIDSVCSALRISPPFLLDQVVVVLLPAK